MLPALPAVKAISAGAGPVPRLLIKEIRTIMEKLELLAQRIDSLIQELNRLRVENHDLREEGKRIREDLELSQLSVEDLQEQLTRERGVREDALTKVDALIGRIQSTLPAVEPQQTF